MCPWYSILDSMVEAKRIDINIAQTQITMRNALGAMQSALNAAIENLLGLMPLDV